MVKKRPYLSSIGLVPGPSFSAGFFMQLDFFHPAVRAWFDQSFDAPTPTQTDAWPAIAVILIARRATARDVMTPGIHCCQEDDDLAKAVRHMEELKVRRLIKRCSGPVG
jgi:hypothetical protein